MDTLKGPSGPESSLMSPGLEEGCLAFVCSSEALNLYPSPMLFDF